MAKFISQSGLRNLKEGAVVSLCGDNGKIQIFSWSGRISELVLEVFDANIQFSMKGKETEISIYGYVSSSNGKYELIEIYLK